MLLLMLVAAAAAAHSDGRSLRRPNKLRWLSPPMISLRQTRLDLHESRRHPGTRPVSQGSQRPPSPTCARVLSGSNRAIPVVGGGGA